MRLGIWLVPLTVVAVLSACGASEEPKGVEQPAGQPAAAAAGRTAASQDGPNGITTYAGSGSPMFAGDGGPAIEAGFYQPTGVAVDSPGNLYLTTDNRVRKVDRATGLISTVAGTGRNKSNGDDGPATSAALAEPHGLVVDSAGDLFVVENGTGRVRKVEASTGVITTVAGGGIGDPRRKIFGDGGPATEAMIKLPTDVAVDADSNVYIATDNRIRKVDAATGLVTTIAGTGNRGLEGDGGPATSAGLAEPISVAVDGEGNIFISDRDNHRIRKVEAATGVMTTVAGIGKLVPRSAEFFSGRFNNTSWNEAEAVAQGAGYSGDGGPAEEAMLSLPTGVAVDRRGDLFIADGGVRVRKVDRNTGVITTIASGEAVKKYETGKIQIHTTTLGNIAALAVNDAGEIFLADYKNNIVHRVAAPTVAP